MRLVIQEFGAPIAAAFVSYLLSVRHTNHKSKEQLISSRIALLVERIEQVAENASLYYSHPPNNESTSREILLQHHVGAISREVSDMNRHCKLRDEGRDSPISAMIHFRKIITGGRFRSSRREALPGQDQLFVEIILSRDRLITQLRRFM